MLVFEITYDPFMGNEPFHELIQQTTRIDRNTLEMRVCIPEYAPEEIDLLEEDGVMFISGTKKEPDSNGIMPDTFQSRFILPRGFNVSEAVLRNGVLVVLLERSTPKKTTVTIIEETE